MSPMWCTFVCILFFGSLSQVVAWRFAVPSILFFLFSGLLLGPCLGWVQPDLVFGDVLFPFISLSLAVIVFEASLNLSYSEIRGKTNDYVPFILGNGIGGFVLNTFAFHGLMSLPWGYSFLLSAIFVVTGPTVVTPILQHIKPREALSSLLKWEAISADILGVVMAALVMQILVGHGESLFLHLVLLVCVGSVLGFIVGRFLVYVLKRHTLPEILQNAVVLSSVLCSYIIGDTITEEAGLVSVAVTGIVMANSNLYLTHVFSFKETLQTILLPILFITLSSRISFSHFQSVDWTFVSIFMFIVFVSRPLTVFLSTLWSNYSFKEKIFLSFLAPRGIVAASIASVFAIHLAESGFSDTSQIESTTYFLIISGTIFYGFIAKPLAHLLGLTEKSPQGILILGGSHWTCEFASILHSLSVKVLLVDSNRLHVQEAKNMGVRALHGDILSESFVEELNVAQVGHFFAMTPNDEINALSILHLRPLFSQTQMYQLFPEKGGDIDFIRQGDILFGSLISYTDIDNFYVKGGCFRVIDVDEDSHLYALESIYGNLIPFLYLHKDSVHVMLGTLFDEKIPAGSRLVAMVDSKGEQGFE